MVGEEHVDNAAVSPHAGQLAHPLEVRGPLDVEVFVGAPPEHQGQHDLCKQDGLQVRLGLDRLGEPQFDFGPPFRGDRVALSLRTTTRLVLAHDCLPRRRARRASVA